MSSDSIKYVDDSSFQSEVLEAAVPVLVSFVAAWAGECKVMEPILEDIATTDKGKALVVKVDIDASPRLSDKYHVKSVPQHLAFRGGNQVGRQVGITTEDKLVEMLGPLS